MSPLNLNNTTSHHQFINLVNATVATSISNYSNYNHDILSDVTDVIPTTVPASTNRTIITTTLDAIFNTTADYLSVENTTKLFENHFDESQTIVPTNRSIDDEELLKKDHVFDRTDVRVIFITMYSLVFCCCFFGKLRLFF